MMRLSDSTYILNLLSFIFFTTMNTKNLRVLGILIAAIILLLAIIFLDKSSNKQLPTEPPIAIDSTRFKHDTAVKH